MPRTFSLSLVCVLLYTLCAGTIFAAQNATAPQFTWTSYLRFWNKSATPLVRLDNAVPSEGGYLANFGHTTTARILMQGHIVTGVSLRFMDGGENDAGGPQFLRLIYHCITVGTYQWSPDKIHEVRETFRHMTPEPKEYMWHYSRFTRTYTPGVGWEFRLDYARE